MMNLTSITLITRMIKRRAAVTYLSGNSKHLSLAENFCQGLFIFKMVMYDDMNAE